MVRRGPITVTTRITIFRHVVNRANRANSPTTAATSPRRHRRHTPIAGANLPVGGSLPIIAPPNDEIIDVAVHENEHDDDHVVDIVDDDNDDDNDDVVDIVDDDNDDVNDVVDIVHDTVDSSVSWECGICLASFDSVDNCDISACCLRKTCATCADSVNRTSYVSDLQRPCAYCRMSLQQVHDMTHQLLCGTSSSSSCSSSCRK